MDPLISGREPEDLLGHGWLRLLYEGVETVDVLLFLVNLLCSVYFCFRVSRMHTVHANFRIVLVSVLDVFVKRLGCIRC